jgi:polyisoprenoid-binding protein YceI
MSTLATPNASTATSLWKIDPVHSNAQFKVKHMMISNVKGEFTAVNGTLRLNDNDSTRSQVEASIDASSINTRDPQRDAHLKSPDFFNVEQFPTLTFKSTRISKKGDDRYSVEGELTIHGVTRNVVLEAEDVSAPAKDPWGNTRIGLSATARINRKDFGLTWNSTLETGGLLVGDEVAITLDVQFIKS